MAEKAIKEIKIAAETETKLDPKVKAKVVRKLRKKYSIDSYNPIAAILVSIAGIFIIIPSVLFGAFTFFSSGFECGLNATVKMYDELISDAKKWAK